MHRRPRTSRALLAAPPRVGIALLVAVTTTVSVGQQPVAAGNSTHGLPAVVINADGGVAADGSDGLRVVLNGAAGGGDVYINGQDQVHYAGTSQYCCSAAAPMLNVGGTLFGEAGPAYDGQSWTTLDVVSQSDAAATVRYTATKDGREYVLERVLTYTEPNDFFTDTYTVTIPDGNTDVVKFYQGGDTAPGSSDSGYGVMLTAPRRSVISLNTSSRIQFGYREAPGGRPFDGATSQGYYTPYETVSSGGDIGFVVTPATHDAGLMMQWNLGSEPGSQTMAMETFANHQGARLTASFRNSEIELGDPSVLDLSLVNTLLTPVEGVGFSFALPAGLVIDDAGAESSCGGTLTAVAGASTAELSGGMIAAADNCVVSVTVASAVAGSYSISAASVTSVAALTNGVGTSTLTVEAPPTPPTTTPPTSPPTTTPPTIPPTTRPAPPAPPAIPGGSGAGTGVGTGVAAPSALFIPDSGVPRQVALPSQAPLAQVRAATAIDETDAIAVTGTGQAFATNEAHRFGQLDQGLRLNAGIVNLAVHWRWGTDAGSWQPSGYWMVGSDGGVFSFGSAPFHGSTGGLELNQPMVAMAGTPTGRGYWLVAADGGVFSFGDARFHGSAVGLSLVSPVVSIVPTATGHGYWLVAADGGVFAYGDATFHGSSAGSGRRIVGAAPAATGRGYWLITGDKQLLGHGQTT